MSSDRSPRNLRLTNSIGFARNVWRLAAPYWRSEEALSAWALLISIVSLNLFIVYLFVKLNTWNGFFYDALQNKYLALFQMLILQFALLACAYILTAVLRINLTLLIQMRWRRWLTERFFDTYFENRNYYLLEVKNPGNDNPDQRIAEDVRMFTSSTISLGVGLLSAITTLVSFIGILWGLSGALDFQLFGHAITIPGYMVWVAIAYALVGTSLTHLIGRRLVTLNFDQQRYEAEFRFGLVRLRENAEGVALYNGEKSERTELSSRFARMWDNFMQIIRYQKRLIGFTAAYDQIATIFPILVAAPRYFSGAIQLGGLMQTSSAFGRVQDSLSWFIGAYSSLAEWRASVDRLIGFQFAIESMAGIYKSSPQQRRSQTRNSLEVSELDLLLPDGSSLSEKLSLKVDRAAHLLIRGRSGKGKSTLLRAISGIWPFWRGSLSRPGPSEVMFLPQRAYLPLGTLRSVLTYPSDAAAFSDEQLSDALAAVGLEQLTASLNLSDNWAQRLSGGEQQRVAVVRALLHQPKWLFLDEVSAALDLNLERQIYTALQSRLPNCTIISVAHRDSVVPYHRLVFDMDANTVKAV